MVILWLGPWTQTGWKKLIINPAPRLCWQILPCIRPWPWNKPSPQRASCHGMRIATNFIWFGCFVCTFMDVTCLCNNESPQNLSPQAPKPHSASDKDSWQMFKYTVSFIHIRARNYAGEKKGINSISCRGKQEEKKTNPCLEHDTLWSNVNIFTAGVWYCR